MYIGMTASVCNLIYVCLILVVYFKKIKLRNDENVIYGFMLFFNFLILILEFFVYLFLMVVNVDSAIIPMVVERLYLVYIFTWVYLFTNYIYMSCCDDIVMEYNLIKNKRYLSIIGSIYLIIVSLISFLPIIHTDKGIVTYSIGPACNVLYISCIMSLVSSFVCIIVKIKQIKYEKYVPLIFLILGLIVILGLRLFIPYVSFLSMVISFVTILTFFTMENPDIKMLRELNYFKMMTERAQNAMMKMLNELQEDLRDSCDKLISFGYREINVNDIDKVNDEIKYIKENSVELVDKISSAIDYAKINNGNYKINCNQYDTYEFIDNIKYYLNYKRGNKDITIIIDVSDNINRVLYGDSEKIKQIVIYLFGYILDFVTDNLINIKIDSLRVRNICRIRFHFYINDGNIDGHISLDEKYGIYKLIGDELDFEIIDRLLELLKGKIEIKKVKNSSLMEILLCIDQRIVFGYDVKNNINTSYGMVRYFDGSDKNILIIDDNNLKIKEMVELLKPYNMNVHILNNIDSLMDDSVDDKYDLIFVDDILFDDNEDNGIKSIDKINQIIKISKRVSLFSVPIVVMITKNNKKIEYECLKSGFDDFIVKPIGKIDLDNILCKYLK